MMVSLGSPEPSMADRTPWECDDHPSGGCFEESESLRDLPTARGWRYPMIARIPPGTPRTVHKPNWLLGSGPRSKLLAKPSGTDRKPCDRWHISHGCPGRGHHPGPPLRRRPPLQQEQAIPAQGDVHRMREPGLRAHGETQRLALRARPYARHTCLPCRSPGTLLTILRSMMPISQTRCSSQVSCPVASRCF